VARVSALHLGGGLALALLLAQVLAHALARGLSLRLPLRVQAIGMAAPLALLLPFLAGDRLLAPTDAPILANLPDAPRVPDPDFAHGVFNDAALQLLPWEAEVRGSYAEGHLPLWSDLLDGGSSPWVNPQAAALSPVAMLGRLLPIEHFLLGALAVKVLLAFEGAWLLFRLLGARRFGAAFGAGGFALGGPVLAWAVFPLSSVVAWSPWLVLGAVRVVRRPASRMLKDPVARVASAAGPDARSRDAGHAGTLSRSGDAADGPAPPRSAGGGAGHGIFQHPARRHVACAALVFAALLLSGHPEIALAECLVAAGFAVIVRRRGGGALRPAGAAALAAAVGISLAAWQLVPFALVAPQSLRASRGERPATTLAAGEPAAGDRAAGNRAAGERAAGNRAAGERAVGKLAVDKLAADMGAPRLLTPGHERLFLGALSPWAFGRPFHEPFTGPGNWPIAAGAYLGLVALAGIAGAVASGRRRRLVFASLALALGIFLLAAGFRPFTWLLGKLPLGGALASDRFLPAAALPLALLAALGLDELLGRRSGTGATRTGGSRAARSTGGGSPTRVSPTDGPPTEGSPIGGSRAGGSRTGRSGTGRPGASLWAMLVAAGASLAVRHDPPLVALWSLTVLGVLLARRRPDGLVRTWGLGLLALASLIDLGAWARDVLPRGHRELFYPRTPLVAAIARAAAAGGPWRATAGGFAVYPSLLPMYGVAEVRIDNPLAPVDQLRLLGEVFDFRPEGRRYKSAFRHLEHPLLDFLNARAIVLPEAAAVPARFRPLPVSGPLKVFENTVALPRFFLPVAADVRGRTEALNAIREMRDPHRVVLLRDDVSSWRPPERPWAPAAVRVLRSRRGRINLQLPPAGEKLLATSLPFAAGWHADAAGRALRPVVVNTAYFGAVIPPGVARVDLSFVPPGFWTGAAGSAVGALALLTLAAASRRRRPAGGTFLRTRGVARHRTPTS
jgi:Bacterial membrane protein YfhO